MYVGAVLDRLVTKGLSRETPSRDECLAVLESGDDDLMAVIAAAGKVRRHFFGNRVKLNLIINMKSGLCPEDCSYCSQRKGSDADILKYNWISEEDAASAADRAVAGGAKRVCLVASGRGPTERDIDRITATVEAIKSRHPDVEICTSLGLLGDHQADRLRAAGVY